jgi:ribonuclease HI
MTLYIKGRNEQVYHVFGRESGTEYYSGYSNNQCEWEGVITAMEYIRDNDLQEAKIVTDSLLLYKQLVGEYRIKNKRIKPFYFRWNELKNQLSGHIITYSHVEDDDNYARSYMEAL